MKLSQVINITLAVSRIRALNWSKQHLTDLPEGRLDPQMKSLLEVIQFDPTAAAMWTKSPAQARADHILSMVLYRRFSPPVAKVPNVWNGSVPGPAGDIPVRFYMPLGPGPFPVLVYFHGGGWVLGNLNTADNVARSLCNYGKMVVISVDYRLAPEHPFPAALEDCYTVTQWAADSANTAEFRGNPHQIVVGGDSAGGNLAAAVCIKARDEQGPLIKAQLLVYPALNASTLDTPSYIAFGEGNLLTTQDMRWFYDHYLPIENDRNNILASPLLCADLSRLPAALVLTAELDVLRDEGEAYADRLHSSGVPVMLIRARNLPHGFLSLREMVKRADRYCQQMMEQLAQMLGQ
ncbi:MAG: alpha/beta hydrolase [Anaerolineae bacterium]|nr:alpha/beta hydrolase [Anaerolineae bacterium]